MLEIIDLLKDLSNLGERFEVPYSFSFRKKGRAIFVFNCDDKQSEAVLRNIIRFVNCIYYPKRNTNKMYTKIIYDYTITYYLSIDNVEMEITIDDTMGRIKKI